MYLFAREVTLFTTDTPHAWLYIPYNLLYNSKERGFVNEGFSRVTPFLES